MRNKSSNLWIPFGELGPEAMPDVGWVATIYRSWSKEQVRRVVMSQSPDAIPLHTSQELFSLYCANIK